MRIDVYHHLGDAPSQEPIQEVLDRLTRLETVMTSAIDQLNESLANIDQDITGLNAALEALGVANAAVVADLQTQLDAALLAGDPAAVEAAIAAAVASTQAALDENLAATVASAAAIANRTPDAPVEPPVV